jgi:hypothetical protein
LAGSSEEEAKRAKRSKKGKKNLAVEGFPYQLFFAFFAALCSFLLPLPKGNLGARSAASA